MAFGVAAILAEHHLRDRTLQFLIGGQHECNPRSPGTHIVGPWVIDSINLYRDLRTGTQYIGNWASRVTLARQQKPRIRTPRRQLCNFRCRSVTEDDAGNVRTLNPNVRVRV